MPDPSFGLCAELEAPDRRDVSCFLIAFGAVADLRGAAAGPELRPRSLSIMLGAYCAFQIVQV